MLTLQILTSVGGERLGAVTCVRISWEPLYACVQKGIHSAGIIKHAQVGEFGEMALFV